MDLFAKIVNGFQLLTILTKSSILDVCLGSKYAFVFIWSFSTWIDVKTGVFLDSILGLLFSL